jgi:aminopeptidase
MKHVTEKFMSNKNRWSVISIPTKAWAQTVFPNVSENEAMNQLWDAIFQANRVYDLDPVKSWEEHNKKLEEKKEFMNKMNFNSDETTFEMLKKDFYRHKCVLTS